MNKEEIIYLDIEHIQVSAALEKISNGLGALSNYCNKNKHDKLAAQRYKILHNAFLNPGGKVIDQAELIALRYFSEILPSIIK